MNADEVRRGARIRAYERDAAAMRCEHGRDGTGDGWHVEGRVPAPWRTVTLGPFETAREAGEAGRLHRLGGRRLYQIRDGKRVV